jgi:pyridine nucleotide-disulfide oxidoreductase family protein
LKRLLLLGAGHSHAQVLREWMRGAPRGVDIVLVSPSALAPYSGMVPGWLAGRYRYQEICIDFAALARAAGARLVAGEMATLDAAQRRVRLVSGETLDYDLLSLNIGSTLEPPTVPGVRVLALRPLGRLHEATEALWPELAAQPEQRHFVVTAVGGGAAGFESLLAVLHRLRAWMPGGRARGGLVSNATALLPGMAPGAVRAALRALHRADVSLRLDTAWSPQLTAGSDLLLWATGAVAHAWQRDPQRRGALAVSEQGFIRIDAQLRSVSHPDIFAVGDCAEWATPLPKAGVYAVRMGPVLAHNLRAALEGRVLRSYAPQSRLLALLATADGRAIASRGRWSAEGRCMWRWKDHIDRGFLRRFEAGP